MTAGVDADGFTVVADGLGLPESPRWHDGALWYCDVRAGLVMRTQPDGQTSVVAALDGDMPSGIAWLPGGALVVTARASRSVLRVVGDGTAPYVELGAHLRGEPNEVLATAGGDLYVGDRGEVGSWDDPVRPGALVLVRQSGSIEVVADDLAFPNGLVVAEGGTRLVVAETRAEPPRLTTFHIREDGRLDDRRTLVELGEERPDGICVDAMERLWVASVSTHEILRIDPGGEVGARLPTGRRAPYACAIGGPRGDTLFVCTGPEVTELASYDGTEGQVLAQSLDDLGA